MPRRTFTARDLAPLREVTRRIVERDPDALLVATAAAPFKRRIPMAGHEERTEVRLPVEIETSTSPEGVPLHAIAGALRREAPGVTGISVTPAGVSVKFDREPTVAQRGRIRALLSDRTRLERLRPQLAPPDERSGQRMTEEDLGRVLRDPRTTDAAWLRAFRRYATEHLVRPPGQPPDPPDRPAGQ